jgi:hypothetical protein
METPNPKSTTIVVEDRVSMIHALALHRQQLMFSGICRASSAPFQTLADQTTASPSSRPAKRKDINSRNERDFRSE